MSGNAWVGEHTGKEDPRLTRISPFLFAQRQVRNIRYLPKLRDLPMNGMDLKAMVFDFGFNPGSTSLGPLATAKINLQIERPVMLWALTGVSDEASVPQIGFQVQLFHTHDGKQRQLFSRHVVNTGILGSGILPMLLQRPYLVLRGDQLTCEVKNLSTNTANANTVNTNVQVVFFGGEF
jgi:hypothetical protein